MDQTDHFVAPTPGATKELLRRYLLDVHRMVVLIKQQT